MSNSITDAPHAFRTQLVKVITENYNFLRDYSSSRERIVLPEKYKTLINNVNGFIVLCDYTTGLYEYISDGVQSHLGYDLKKLSNMELTNFIFSVIDDKHAKFMINSLLPVVFKYFKENATHITGTDYRYSVCIKIKNIYNVYAWYLVDTVVIEVDATGFPMKTLI